MRGIFFFGMTFLLLLIGCSREEPVVNSQQRIVADAKKYYDQQITSPKAQRFLRALKLHPLWEEAVIDDFGSFRIPMVSEYNMTNIFEIKIWRTKEELVGKYQQFMPGRNGYTNLPFSFRGDRLFRLTTKKKKRLRKSAHSSSSVGSKANNEIPRGVAGALSGDESVDIYDYEAYRQFLLNTSSHEGAFPVSVNIMPCPDSLLFDSKQCNCKFAANIGSGFAYPKFYMLVYEDGFYEFVPYVDSLEEVVVVTDPNNLTEPGGGNTGPIGGVGGGSGGGSNGGSSSHQYPIPTNAEVLGQIRNKPFALLGNIPCDIIKSWLSIAQFEPSTDIINKLSSIATSITPSYNSGGGFMPITNSNVAWIQNINAAYSTIVNMDYFPVTIKQLPVVNGQQLTGVQFLDYIRLHINDFVDNNTFTPYNAYGINDNALWHSYDPTGTIIAIDIYGPDNGSVVTSYSGQDKWTFTTIHEPMYGNHPVSGNRDFGFIWNIDGSYTFYTKGVDRLTTTDASILNQIASKLGRNFPFNLTDDLWNSFQNHITDFVNQNRGNASVITPETYRPNWSIVKEVLDGREPLSSLSSDCPDAIF